MFATKIIKNFGDKKKEERIIGHKKRLIFVQKKTH